MHPWVGSSDHVRLGAVARWVVRPLRTDSRRIPLDCRPRRWREQGQPRRRGCTGLMPGDEVRWPGRKPPPALPKRQARIRWKTCGDVRTGACECACAGGREQPREAWAVLQADPYWNGQASGFSSEAIRDRREGSGMRRLARSPVLFAAMLSFGFLAAGCGHSGAGAAIASLSPSRSVSVPSVSVPSRSASFSPGVSFSPTATAEPPAGQSATAPARRPSRAVPRQQAAGQVRR